MKRLKLFLWTAKSQSIIFMLMQTGNFQHVNVALKSIHNCVNIALSSPNALFIWSFSRNMFFSIQFSHRVQSKNLSVIGWTDVCNVAEITLARLSRLQCHFGIKGICLSMKTYGMQGIKGGKAGCLYSIFCPK